MTTHSFDVDEAIKYGMESAVLLTNIRFWLTKNKANNVHAHDGYYWTYNSSRAFLELFPYMSQKSITRYLKLLEQEGAIKIGNYNKRTSDKTGWYTIPTEFALKKEEQLILSQNDSTLSQNDSTLSQNDSTLSQNDSTLSQNDSTLSQNDSALPNINTDIITDTKTTTKAAVFAAVDNSLSEELQACWKWAKKQDFWRSKVYNQKAFLKHYNAESGALKGQYEVSLELQREEAEKANAKKVPAKSWQLQGFKSEQDYNAAHLQKLKQMEANARVGRAANG
jgi:hypothetical protein